MTVEALCQSSFELYVFFTLIPRSLYLIIKLYIYVMFSFGSFIHQTLTLRYEVKQCDVEIKMCLLQIDILSTQHKLLTRLFGFLWRRDCSMLSVPQAGPRTERRLLLLTPPRPTPLETA